MTVISVIVFIFYIYSKIWLTPKHIISSVILPNVVVHLDLKGPAPKLKYLESLLPLLKSHGVNGLLVEYEDMFPYEGHLVNLSAKNCYRKAELKKFLSTVHRFGLEVIPLIQTFGHLEFALKLPQFMHLREISQYPDSVCPSKAESLILINQMIQQVFLEPREEPEALRVISAIEFQPQVIDFHNSIAPLKYIHIGCDEVYHINECIHCRKRNLSTVDLFLQHVKSVLKTVNGLSPKTIVLIWDDMLRGISLSEWYKINFLSFNNIEVVYWDYEAILKVSHVNLMKYHKKFSNTWIASAFKGADGRTAIFPNDKMRLANHFSWFNLILGYKFGGEKETHHFKGIILTGWSRYSHMDPPCELLQASIPSLIINLLNEEKSRV
ncbi:hexosaminidase D [Aphomia sociella]